MKTLEQKFEIIENAIDAIIDVAEDIEESDATYFMNSYNSVVYNLRRLQRKIEEAEDIENSIAKLRN